MKVFLIMPLFFLSAGVFAQTKTFKRIDPELNRREVFTVLKSNEQIKDGEFKAYNLYNNVLLYQGYYKNDQRDSIWAYEGFKTKSAVGSFKEGKRIGIWKTYNYDGSVKMEYDFDNNKLLNLTPVSTDKGKRYGLFTANGMVDTLLDQPPLFLSGEVFISKILVTNVRYPQVAREKNIQGTVIIGITINETGQIEGYRIKQHVDGGCDEEAMRVVKRITGDWLPGMLNGKPVKVEFNLPLSFTLAN